MVAPGQLSICPHSKPSATRTSVRTSNNEQIRLQGLMNQNNNLALLPSLAAVPSLPGISVLNWAARLLKSRPRKGRTRYTSTMQLSAMKKERGKKQAAERQPPAVCPKQKGPPENTLVQYTVLEEIDVLTTMMYLIPGNQNCLFHGLETNFLHFWFLPS